MVRLHRFYKENSRFNLLPAAHKYYAKDSKVIEEDFLSGLDSIISYAPSEKWDFGLGFSTWHHRGPLPVTDTISFDEPSHGSEHVGYSPY